MANNEPHTHEIVIKRHYSHTDDGPIEIKYGDTTVTTLGPFKSFLQVYPRNNPSAKKIRKATLKVIRQHDKGSIKKIDNEAYAKPIEDIKKKLAANEDCWGSDLIND